MICYLFVALSFREIWIYSAYHFIYSNFEQVKLVKKLEPKKMDVKKIIIKNGKSSSDFFSRPELQLVPKILN